MSDRAPTFLRANARLSGLTAFAPVAAALEQWGDGTWRDVGTVGFAALWAIAVALVLVELAVALRYGEGRLRALFWLGLVALANPWAEPLIEALLGVRAARSVRLRREFADQLGRQVFSGRGLRFAGGISVLGLVSLGWLFTVVEDRPGVSVGDGIWFALVTAATVGYGDIVPTTTAGRVIGAVLMVLGLVVAGLLTGAVAERFTRNRRPDDEVAHRLDELLARLERIEAGLGRARDLP